MKTILLMENNWHKKTEVIYAVYKPFKKKRTNDLMVIFDSMPGCRKSAAQNGWVEICRRKATEREEECINHIRRFTAYYYTSVSEVVLSDKVYDAVTPQLAINEFNKHRLNNI